MREENCFKRKRRKRKTGRWRMEVMRKRMKSSIKRKRRKRMMRVREREITLQSPTSTTQIEKLLLLHSDFCPHCKIVFAVAISLFSFCFCAVIGSRIHIY